MRVHFVESVEQILYRLILLSREKNHIVAAEMESAFVFQCVGRVVESNIELERTDFRRVGGCGTSGLSSVNPFGSSISTLSSSDHGKWK